MRQKKSSTVNDYVPKLKVGDQVLSIEDRYVGTIKQIDNYCSKIYDFGYENPGHLEYYVKWKSGAWTRHYCFALDAGKSEIDGSPGKIVPLTEAVKILYAKTRNRKSVRFK